MLAVSGIELGMQQWQVGFVDGFTCAAFLLLLGLAIALEFALTELGRRGR